MGNEEPLTLARFLAKSRVMHSFQPTTDKRTKNEYVADELIAAGYAKEIGEVHAV